MGAERAAQQVKRLGKWIKANPWRQAVLAAAGVAALAVVVADKESIQDWMFGNPGFCSETGRMIPLTAAIPERHVYNAENTNGGVLNAPVRAMKSTRFGILFAHASPNGAPDPNNPESPLRYLTTNGIEICQARTLLKGSANVVFEHPGTAEIIVGYDSGDPNAPKNREGNAVSIFDSRARKWTHFKNIPYALDPRVYGAGANGLETWFATYKGISYHYPNEAWRKSLNFPDQAFHAVMVTKDRTQAVAGHLTNGLHTYPKSPELENHPKEISKVRDIQESPDGREIWVAADGGLAFYQRQQRRWQMVSLPQGAKEVMAIRFRPVTSQPSVVTFDKGTFSWDGTGFAQIDSRPALSLAFGQVGSFLDPYIFVGTRFDGIVQIPLAKQFDKIN